MITGATHPWALDRRMRQGGVLKVTRLDRIARSLLALSRARTQAISGGHARAMKNFW